MREKFVTRYKGTIFIHATKTFVCKRHFHHLLTSVYFENACEVVYIGYCFPKSIKFIKHIS